MTPAVLTEFVLNGLVLGALYVLMALGLSIIFGMIGVINFAHGALFTLGAYVAFQVKDALGFPATLVVSPVLVGVLGMLIEATLLRRLYREDPLQGLLLTFGLTMVLEQGIRMVWGLSPKQFDVPPAFGGALRLGALTYSKYRSFILLAVVVLIVALTLFLQKTPVGTIVRAGSRDPMMVRLLGISLKPVLTLVFGLGTAFAAIAGVLSAPLAGVQPAMGVNVGTAAFVVVTIGGLGSFWGAIVSGLLVGQVVSLSIYFQPRAAEASMYILMAVILLLRPLGLLRDRRLRGGARPAPPGEGHGRPLRRRRRGRRARRGGDRLPPDAQARRLLLASDARVHADVLLHRLRGDGGDGGRKRPRRNRALPPARRLPPARPRRQTRLLLRKRGPRRPRHLRPLARPPRALRAGPRGDARARARRELRRLRRQALQAHGVRRLVRLQRPRRRPLHLPAELRLPGVAPRDDGRRDRRDDARGRDAELRRPRRGRGGVRLHARHPLVVDRELARLLRRDLRRLRHVLAQRDRGRVPAPARPSPSRRRPRTRHDASRASRRAGARPGGGCRGPGRGGAARGPRSRQALRRARRGRRRVAPGPARRAPLDHRAERGRQDDALQRPHRPPARRPGPGAVPRDDDHRAPPAPDRGVGRLALVSDHQ